jgi:ClpP class serine protease
MSQSKRFRESPSGGPLALHPRALSIVFDVNTARENDYESIPGAAVVWIEGPLEQRAGCFDGYDAIQERFDGALAEKCSTVILRINSPGGEVAGLNEAVRAMRAAAKTSKKTIITYVDEAAYSAAYALATVADRIVLPESGGVGSIGVITEVIDRTEMNEKEGVKVAVIASGALKTDGHPDVPITDGLLQRTQDRVNDLADQFGALVAEKRGGDAEDYLALEAGTFMGQDAVSRGLADRVSSWAELCQELSGDTGTVTQRVSRLVPMAKATSEAASVSASSEEKKMRKVVKKSSEVEESYESESEEAEEAEEAAEDAEDAEDAEEASAEADDDGDDDDAPPSSEGRRGSRYKKAEASILSVARRVTGKTDPREVLGALEALGHSRSRLAALSAKVERLEKENRRAKVTRMVAQAIRDGKIAPSQKEWATRTGLESPKTLKAYLETAPKLVRSESREIGPEGEKFMAAQTGKEVAVGIWEKFGLDAAGQAKAAELLTQEKARSSVAGGRN